MVSNLLAGIRFYRAGRVAAAEIPRIRGKVWKGFLLSLVVLLLIGGLLGGLSFAVVFVPMKVWLLGRLPDWATWVGGTLAALAGISLGLVALVSSLRFTVILLGFFFEGPVCDVVQHFRPEAKPNQRGPSILFELFREAFYLFVMLLLPFVPAAGAFLAAAFSCWLVGKGIHAPHRTVLMQCGLEKPNPSHVACMTSGVAELLLLLIPVAGWFLLPWVMIHMVIGQAWLYEEDRQSPVMA